MDAKVRSGPEPTRLRLDTIDAVELAETLRALVVFAQTGDGSYVRPPRVLMEAVQVAHDAARARACLKAGTPVPPRWLAALSGLATSRIRQIARSGGLRRSGAAIEATSASAWLASDGARYERRYRPKPGGRRLVSVKPSWWGGEHHCGALCDRVAEIVKQMLPSGVVFGFDFRSTPYFEAVDVVLDEPAIETLRAEIRGALEAKDPAALAWTPDEEEPTSVG